MSVQKVLVTGAEGYIGTVLSDFLMRGGFDVVGLDTGFYRDGVLYHSSHLRPKLITKDVRNVAVEDLSAFDAVVHLAELSNDPLGDMNENLTYEVNQKGSLGLAAAAKKAGVKRFVYASSCSVYGASTSNSALTETAELNPQTAYARCKALVELGLAELNDHSFSTVALRNATAFGASPHMRFDIVLNNLVGLAHTTGKIRMLSDGSPWRPIVHIEDISRAARCCLEAPRDAIHGEVFNVGDDDHNYQIREIAEAVKTHYPDCELEFGDLGGDTRSYRVSFEKIRKHLPDFTCEWSALAGVEELKAVLTRIGLDDAGFKHRPYTRLSQLKYLTGSGQVSPDLHWAA